MNLDQFLAQAPTTLASYAERMRELDKTDPTMAPDRQRAEEWWWRDVSAYLRYVELEEQVRR